MELPSELDPQDFSQAGWGAIFPWDKDYSAKYRLQRLLDYRRQQAGKLYKEFAYKEGESPRAFLWYRHGVAPGVIDPAIMPYHLLIVGNPKEVPDSLEHELRINRMVERVYFDNAAHYEDYAQRIIEEEQYVKPDQEDSLLSKKIEILSNPISRKIFKYLADNPRLIFEFNPREFEMIIAALLEEMGCDVTLTPLSHDGGRDIVASFSAPFGGKLAAIVECKRYNPRRKVGLELVQRFLWVLDNEDNASCGLIVTTSYFTSGAYDMKKKHKSIHPVLVFFFIVDNCLKYLIRGKKSRMIIR